MNWRERLAKLVAGESGVITYDAIPELQQVRAGFIQRARQMRRHAEHAPNQLNRQELARLAAEEDAHVQQLTEAITALGGQPIDPPALVAIPGALNHWARLVQDLEAHRSAMRRLREEAIHFAETLPDTAALFDRLCLEEERHGVHLRDLIARTDPHAIN